MTKDRFFFFLMFINDFDIDIECHAAYSPLIISGNSFNLMLNGIWMSTIFSILRIWMPFLDRKVHTCICIYIVDTWYGYKIECRLNTKMLIHSMSADVFWSEINFHRIMSWYKMWKCLCFFVRLNSLFYLFDFRLYTLT